MKKLYWGFKCRKCNWRQTFESTTKEAVLSLIRDKSFHCGCIYKEGDHILTWSNRKLDGRLPIETR